MLVETALIVKEALRGANLTPTPPAPRTRIKLTSHQRTRLEFVLKKLRIFGETNRFHNAAYIESLISHGEDRRTQYSPSLDCLAVVEDILYNAGDFQATPEEPFILALNPVLAAD